MKSAIAAAFALCLVGSTASASSPGGKADLPSAEVERLAALAGGPPRPALRAALVAYDRAVALGRVARTGLLTVLDYTRPSTEPRLWVIDLSAGRILYRELVAHGRGSGGNVATRFSNVPGSFMTSLGLFVTGASYVGANGYSLRLRGLEPGLNDKAFARAIVVHGAAYVSRAFAKGVGRLGRSLGCPAVGDDVARPLIDDIKGGTVVFAYGGQPPPTANSLQPEGHP